MSSSGPKRILPREMQTIDNALQNMKNTIFVLSLIQEGRFSYLLTEGNKRNLTTTQLYDTVNNTKKLGFALLEKPNGKPARNFTLNEIEYDRVFARLTPLGKVAVRCESESQILSLLDKMNLLSRIKKD